MLLPSPIASVSTAFAAVSAFSAVSASSADTRCEARFLRFCVFAVHDLIIKKDVGIELHGGHCSEARACCTNPGKPLFLVQCPDESTIDGFVIPSLAEGQMKLDLFDEVTEIIDVLAHCSLRCLLEVVELFLKDA
jgi:hypothetical protein